MLKTLAMTTAIGALTITGALAQSTTPPPASPPAAMPPAASAPLMDAKFVSSQGSDHWVFSKFKGTDVLGPDNAHIGDVDDVLFTKDGKVMALIVGVGGFLGIGEKNVAIDPSAFQVAMDTNSNDPTNVKLKTSWTKDQLKNAPAFEYYKPAARTTGTAPSGTTGQAPRTAPPARP